MTVMLLTSVLTSCGAGDDPDIDGTRSTAVVLFNVSGAERFLSGRNVYTGSRSGIQEVTGTASSDATTVDGLPLSETNRLPSKDFPHGISLDGFGEGGRRDLGSVWLCCSEFGFIYQVHLGTTYRTDTYLAAPVSGNENPAPEYSMVYRTFVQDSGRPTIDYYYNNSFGFYGVAGFTNDVQPIDPAQYQGIWVGKVSDSNEFWGEARLSVNFETGKVTGILDNPVRPVGSPDVVVGDITITGDTFDGEIIGEALVDIDFGAGALAFSGPVDGLLFGPSAEETGGVFDTSSDLSTHTFSGAFLAKQ